MNTGTLDFFTLGILLLLVIVTPLFGIWDFRRLLRWTEDGRTDARIKTYNWILVVEWGLTLGLLAWWIASGREFGALGLVPDYYGWRWLAVAMGVGGSLFLLWQMVTVAGKPGELAKMREQMGELSALIPRNPAESRAFAMVSVTAGICEEIVYRGMLMGALIPALGLWPAVALSSVIFGMGHVYQGMTGIIKTTLVGVFMALLTVFSGSLLVAIVLHAIIDLTSGRLMGAALALPETPEAPEGPEGLVNNH
jgi:membrane protease YdiL (CAAX protease family)